MQKRMLGSELKKNAVLMKDNRYVIMHNTFWYSVLCHYDFLQYVEHLRLDIKSTLADDSKATNAVLVVFRLPNGTKVERKFSPTRLVKVNRDFVLMALIFVLITGYVSVRLCTW